MSDISKIPALKDLFDIINCDNKLERECRFFAWKNKWVTSIEKSQLVLNRSTMSSEDHDFTCEYLTRLCVEELLEKNIVNITTTQNSYTAKIMVIKNGKLEKN